MSDKERCPNCGYCPHCGRSDAKPAQPVQPLWPNPVMPWPRTAPWLSGNGWYCACGAWVGSHQVHVCPLKQGPTWTVTAGGGNFGGATQHYVLTGNEQATLTAGPGTAQWGPNQ